jgi:Carboxypeptidase regulatory-like domain
MRLFIAFRLIVLGTTAPRTVVSSLARTRAFRRGPYSQSCALLAWASLLLCMAPAGAHAQQQTAALGTDSGSLPDAPLPQQGEQSLVQQTSSAEASASVSGTVLDSSGAAIPGAQVTLTHRDGRTLQTLVSGARGEFTFSKLQAGSYIAIVEAKGFAPFTSAEFDLVPKQSYEIPSILLSVASATTEVTVRPTEVIAAEQIKGEEKQRLLGIIPNFYVSYVHDAAPLTVKQKFSLASHDTLDWTSFVGVSIAAGIEQGTNAYAGYGQGAAGYGKRWAARFGDGRSSDFLSHAVFASLFHQDPRYFYQGTGTTKSRLYHAVSNAFVARSDSGHLMPNYSYLLGTMCSGALSNAYYPHADRGANLVFTNAFIGIAGRAGASVAQEFLGKRLTKNVPDNGKP